MLSDVFPRARSVPSQGSLNARFLCGSGSLGLKADGGFVIFIGRVDAAEFGFCDADKVLE